MKISGFTFVRNAVKLDYPVVESIRSILPIVDEFVVNVGESEDETNALIRSIGSPKIRIVESKWNANVNTGGFVLAQQTNIALFNCTGEWAIYLQADEAIHERDHGRLVELMEKYRSDDGVEGLVLQRVWFFGDYNTVIAHPSMCDLICRAVKPHRFVLSRGDAAGFTVHPKYKERGRRIRVVDTGLPVFHYSDIRSTAVSSEFQRARGELWTDASVRPTPDYYQSVPRQFVAAYRGSHPASMQDRIANSAPSIDLGSPRWRSTFTARERRRYRRWKLLKMLGGTSFVQRMNSSDNIVATHRTTFVGEG